VFLGYRRRLHDNTTTSLSRHRSKIVHHRPRGSAGRKASGASRTFRPVTPTISLHFHIKQLQNA
jgi:hypothetical protein